jgi:hypothetical protein
MRKLVIAYAAAERDYTIGAVAGCSVRGVCARRARSTGA